MWNPFKKAKPKHWTTGVKESISELGSKIPKGVKRAGLYGLGAAGIYYGAKAAMHASVLKTDDPRYKALRKSGLLDDKAHKKQLAYWKKRNA
tara:strand:+ start:277 stop:552 length:276 start_codon:yes stop_codon:yes gene_type:complete